MTIIPEKGAGFKPLRYLGPVSNPADRVFDIVRAGRMLNLSTPMIIPLRVETLMERWPWANFLIMAATAGFSIAAWLGAVPEEAIEAMVLADWEVSGLFGYMLLHGDLLHLVFNLIFLWVFGNTVCAKVGNFAYLALYAGLGVAAGAVHLFFDGAPAIGASGALNGVIGFYFFLHPINRIHCFWWIFIMGGRFDVAGYWLILMWLAFDLLGALTGAAGIAYWAHLGGFGAGFALAFALYAGGLIQMTVYDNGTLLDLLRPDEGTD